MSRHSATHDLCPSVGGPGPCEFDSFDLSQGEGFAHTFPRGDVYRYLSPPHGFIGLVVVDDPEQFPDLFVSELRVTDQSLLTKRIDVTVRNVGADGAIRSHLLVGYRYQGEVETIEEPSVVALAIGESRTIQATWKTLGKMGDFIIEARADAQGEVVELA